MPRCHSALIAMAAPRGSSLKAVSTVYRYPAELSQPSISVLSVFSSDLLSLFRFQGHSWRLCLFVVPEMSAFQVSACLGWWPVLARDLLRHGTRCDSYADRGFPHHATVGESASSCFRWIMIGRCLVRIVGVVSRFLPEGTACSWPAHMPALLWGRFSPDIAVLGWQG